MLLPRGVAPWPPMFATWGPGGESGLHAHHAIHLLLCADGRTLRVRASARGPWRDASGVLTAPDEPHAIDARGARVLLVFLDPESDVGAALASSVTAGVRLLDAAERDRLLDGTDDPRVVVERLSARDLPLKRRVHPRVRRALGALRPGEEPSLAELAAAADLSPGRFMHAFTESIGIPIRPYLLWLKVQRAAAAMAAGEPLARAAASGGFTDAAHMTRTFRRMFGMTPSAIRASLLARS